jgi:hypothetical protein
MKLTSLGEVIKFEIHHFPTVSFVHNCKKNSASLQNLGTKSPRQLHFVQWDTEQHLWARSTDRAACHPSGICTFEVASRFFENLCTAVT